MFVKAIRTAKKAMFPIFRLEHVSQTHIKVISVRLREKNHTKDCNIRLAKCFV